MRSRKATVKMWLHDELVEVVVSYGPREPPGTPWAGTRDIEVVSVRATSDGEDLTDHADELDGGLLAEAVEEHERDAAEAEAEAQMDADRERRF